MTRDPLAALDAQRAAARANRELFAAERPTDPTSVATDFAALEQHFSTAARKVDSAVALHSFGVTTAPGMTRAEPRAKADALPAHPVTVRTWADVLTFQEQAALAVITRLYQAEGSQPILLNAGILAPLIRHSFEETHASLTDKAQEMLTKFLTVGALIEHKKLAAPSRFEPVARPPATTAQKSDAAGAPVAFRVTSALGLRSR